MKASSTDRDAIRKLLVLLDTGCIYPHRLLTFFTGFLSGPVQVPPGTDPHVASGVLKAFINKIPDEKLISAANYDALMSVSGSSSNCNLIKLVDLEDVTLSYSKLVELIDTLPNENKILLKHLMVFLRAVAARVEITKVTPAQLGAVMGPILLQAKSPDDKIKIAKVVRMLICK